MNHLALEKSPYLRSHAENPVAWHPWGEAAFALAKREDKPIFLSIGYSSCHWCHVMAHDSFEREDVAAVLNANFVSIKVDREERPDVDRLYMDAVVGLTGSGGWPMSVFLTPDRKPFFGGTFFYRGHFLALLDHIDKAWREEREKVNENADRLTDFLRSSDIPMESDPAAPTLDLTQLPELFEETLKTFRLYFDPQFGGFGGAPKFPKSFECTLLLKLYQRTQAQSALDMAKFTLEQMARGGIRDHLGGGFHRYAVDHEWTVPHFEKMLSDNALLASAYLDLFLLTKENRHASVAKGTLNYLLRKLRDSSGGFYAAEDADSGGKEGAFYAWSFDELSTYLSKADLTTLQEFYDIRKEGNFEGEIVLRLLKDAALERESEPDLLRIRETLFKIREGRIPPKTDTKVLCSLNGLALSALSKGYRALGDPVYLSEAQTLAKFMQNTFMKDGRLFHSYCDGELKWTGLLEDYAFLISGLLDLSEIDPNPQWIEWARSLQDLSNSRFQDPLDHLYFTTDANEGDLLIRKKDFSDTALPSQNSTCAFNLLRLFEIVGEPGYKHSAEAILGVLIEKARRHPMGFSTALLALDRLHHPILPDQSRFSCSPDGICGRLA